MAQDRFLASLAQALAELDSRGNPKRFERVVTEVLPPRGEKGPRFRLAGEGQREFLRFNSNHYLGLGFRAELLEAEETAARKYGTGPGAVRFISGTTRCHLELEERLAAFHGREAAMLFSAAYAAMLGALVPLLRPGVAIVSDELNHNCIIQAIRLARPEIRRVYPHNDLAALELSLKQSLDQGARAALVVTDGVFSMRGDLAPLCAIQQVLDRWDPHFPENALLVVDDSHGVGALGATGRGSEEELNAPPAELLVGTLGKAFCVNGGYVVASRGVVDYLRETAATYIYSNPISAGEAAAALRALELLDSAWGRDRLATLRALTDRFRQGLVAMGFETVPGVHPVVPLLVRDTARTTWLVGELFRAGILATGLNYPVVPRGQETIRFQVNADHTPSDIDLVLEVLDKLRQVTMPSSG